MGFVFVMLGQKVWKTCFWKIWVEYKCFWKTFHLILMHSIHKILCFEEFMHKIALFFRFSIDWVWISTNRKIPDFSSLASAWLDWYLIDARLIEIGEKKIQFLSIWPVYFFHHLYLGFTCIAFFSSVFLKNISFHTHAFYS